MSNRWVDELMPDQPMWVRDLVDEELRRKEASVERTARAFRACEQAREDAAALHRAEVERLTAAIEKYEADDVRYLKDRAAWDAEAAGLRAKVERSAATRRELRGVLRELRVCLRMPEQYYEIGLIDDALAYVALEEGGRG